MIDFIFVMFITLCVCILIVYWGIKDDQEGVTTQSKFNDYPEKILDSEGNPYFQMCKFDYGVKYYYAYGTYATIRYSWLLSTFEVELYPQKGAKSQSLVKTFLILEYQNKESRYEVSKQQYMKKSKF